MPDTDPTPPAVRPSPATSERELTLTLPKPPGAHKARWEVAIHHADGRIVESIGILHDEDDALELAADVKSEHPTLDVRIRHSIFSEWVAPVPVTNEDLVGVRLERRFPITSVQQWECDVPRELVDGDIEKLEEYVMEEGDMVAETTSDESVDEMQLEILGTWEVRNG